MHDFAFYSVCLNHGYIVWLIIKNRAVGRLRPVITTVSTWTAAILAIETEIGEFYYIMFHIHIIRLTSLVCNCGDKLINLHTYTYYLFVHCRYSFYCRGHPGSAPYVADCLHEPDFRCFTRCVTISYDRANLTGVFLLFCWGFLLFLIIW